MVIGFFFTAVVIVLLSTLASLFLKLQCHGPEILGYVTSLIRDSPYFPDGIRHGTMLEQGKQGTYKNLST